MVHIVLNAELIDVAPMTDSVFDCQVDDILFVAVDYLADVVAVGGHLVGQFQLLVDQDVIVQLGKLFFLINRKLPSLLALNKTVQSVG